VKTTWLWAGAGAALGTLVASLAFAPAAWLANALAAQSGERLQLTDTRGTLWRGSGVLVLGGGPDSRSAMALPGRLSWKLSWRGRGLALHAQQACCLHQPLRLSAEPGLGRMTLRLAPTQGVAASWPAAWLAGLGAPWNTLQLGGTVRLASTGLSLESAQGRVAISGGATLTLEAISSRLSTQDPLGSYQLSIDGQREAGGSAALNLATLKGPLLLSGSGVWGGASGAALRFRGEARAQAGAESALDNLLNVIGRRQGALSVLTIG
jgi:general secretion pathway protein N